MCSFPLVCIQLGGIHKRYAVRKRMRVGYRWSRANQYGYVCSGEYMNTSDVLSRQADFTISATALSYREKTCPLSSRPHRFRVLFLFSSINEKRVRYLEMVFCNRYLSRSLSEISLDVKLKCYVRWIFRWKEVFGKWTANGIANEDVDLSSEQTRIAQK